MKQEHNKREEIKGIIKWLLVVVMMVMLSFTETIPVHAEEGTEALKAELLEMLMNVDTSTHDIYDYQLTSKQVQAAWLELIEEEGYLPFHTYESTVLVFPSKKNGYADKVYICGMDNGFQERYENVQACVKEVQSATTGMSDLEKVLYVHDYVVEHTTYDKTAVAGSQAGGPLGNGTGYCSGYADAVAVLLKCVNVPCVTVHSSNMQHDWCYAQINGKWYHIDATWDDTRSKKSGQVSHEFFMRNDAEFESALSSTHSDWSINGISVASTSTTYEDWFVHDILGKMFYYDGLWYYVDNETGNIVSSEIDTAQSSYKIRVNKKTIGASKLEITKVESGIIYYTADGESCKAAIKIDLNSDIHFEFDTIQGANQSSSIITPSTSNTTSSTTTTTSSTFSWNSILLWKSGCYSNQTGSYYKDTSRICLNSYVSVSGSQAYQVKLSNANCSMLIRELASNKAIITAHNLPNGAVFETQPGTAYLAISLYMPNNPSATYLTYQSMFTSGITIGLAKTTKPDVNSSNLKWENLGYWRVGHYSQQTGTFLKSYYTRICLNDYVSISPNKKYTVVLSDSQYRMLIREMTSNKTFIKSHNLSGGSSFTTTANTAYLAISLYMPSKDSSAIFADYQSVIASGPALTLVQ